MLLWKKFSLLLPWKLRAREQSLEEELRSHLDLAAEEAMEQGATPEQARFAARRDLGSTLGVEEDARSVWVFHWWEQFQRDVLYAIRSLRHAPLFTVVAILSLGLGIGSATAMFSLLNGVLLKPLAYRQPNQLIAIHEVVAPLANTYPSLPVNYQHFLFWREHAQCFESLAAMEAGSASLTGAAAIKVDTAAVSTNLFALLGVQPELGRFFLPEEGRRGHDRVAVLTDSLWSERFGSDPRLIGKTITLDGFTYTVAGILPPAFRFFKNNEFGPLTGLGKNTAIFLPLSGSYNNGWGGDYDYIVVGRLKPNVSVTQAAAELDILERRLEADHALKQGLHVVCTPLHELISNPVRTPLNVLMAAVSLLLLIVCVNLANLLLARSSARTREFSIRTALGARRGRLIAQILVETLILGLAGGILGLGLAAAAVHAFVTRTAVPIPRLDEVQIDGGVFFFSLVVSLACGLLSGWLPALRLTNVDSQASLRSGRHIPGGTKQSLRIREILIGIEVAISVVLLFGAGLIHTSLIRLLNVDKGFSSEDAVALAIALPSAHYKTAQDDIRFWDQALDTLHSIPGVESAAYTTKLPLTGESMVNDVVPEGSTQSALDPATQKLIEINVRYVSPEYFAALGIPLLQGRVLEPQDRVRHVALISARLAAKVWPGQNALGKSLTTGASVGKVIVVGIVKDVHATTLDREPTLMAYVPYWHRGLDIGDLVIRTRGDARNLLPVIRRRLQTIDPSLPNPEAFTIRHLVTESLSRRYFQGRLSNGFALAALALALIGIYGVVAYNAVQRRTEIAIRLALGASRSDVFRMLIRSGLRPVGIGLAAGVIAALACARFIRSLLFGVEPTDPEIALLVVMLLAITALFACLLPARSAVAIDPANTLRYE